ncbi:MAG: signal peptidase I [Proteobacteria bacterium]|nr:MAG: signal peptidase I [Pseudomonadota bacterium]PIE40431.1 MAG: signal peptidase I [Gammaproteobacteria bacterium]
MDIDFPLILVLLTFGTGLIWLADRVFLYPSRKNRAAALTGDDPATIDSREDLTDSQKEALAESSVVEMSRSFFPVLLVVLILRSFLVEPFQIPSGSMLPTLEVGDFILVNKFTYGIRLPVLGTKIVELNDPRAGDVLVFRFPRDGKTNYIKRVVGTPGDIVQYRNKRLIINGKMVTEEFEGQINRMDMYLENLEGTRHFIYKNSHGKALLQEEGEWKIPDGHYFVMGDNRDNSNDSRFWGLVPDEMIVGKAFAIWMHWETLFSIPGFSRVGSIDKVEP